MGKYVNNTCPICGKRSYLKFTVYPEYGLFKCRGCGMVWDPKRGVDLSKIYDRDYFNNNNPKGGYVNYFEGMKINRKTFSDRLKRISKKVGKGKLLDVGCALGDCLIEAKKLGWINPQGLEISTYAYIQAMARGVSVRNGSIGNISAKGHGFDVITYQDVIEHVINPLNELKEVYKRLNPGGLLYMVTPDIGGFWSIVLGKYWYHFKKGEHLMYFSEDTISAALRKAGYKNIETKNTYHILSVNYILDRLKFYFPVLFGFLKKVVKKTPLDSYSFRAYTGEIEVWAYKPM